MKKYIRAYTTIASWYDHKQPDTDYLVLERMDGSLVWEGAPWDLPEEYKDLTIADTRYDGVDCLMYDGAGTCILTVRED